MQDAISVKGVENRDTQLLTIRDLMLSAARRGAWLTLGEIARLTEIGEASISAQLRHLRKSRHGRHRVEKRRRTRAVWYGLARGSRGDAKRRAGDAVVVWEYRVLPPLRWEAVLARADEEDAGRDARSDSGTGEIPSVVQSSATEEARHVESMASAAERSETCDADSSGAPGR